MLFAMHPLFPMSELALSKTILIDALEGQWPNAVSLCEKSLTGVQLEVVSYSALLAHFLLGTPANCAPLGHLQVGNFLPIHGTGPSPTAFMGRCLDGTPMTIQGDHSRHGTRDQLTLLGAAAIVLLFYAWTCLD
jgi:hypothetical protein